MTDKSGKLRPMIANLEDIPPVACACGWTRRAFLDPSNRIASLHLVDVKSEPQTHYHRRQTEIYYILEGEGFIELDGESTPVKAGSAVLIPAEVRHRLVGKMRFLNVPIPPFDPEDEILD
jgi:mannose-6-phosphate isomerase-like protein (cupin superfamily)